jgi:hypothetical protein
MQQLLDDIPWIPAVHQCGTRRQCKQASYSMLLQLLSCHYPQQQLKYIACVNVGGGLLADRTFITAPRDSFFSAAGLASAAAAHLLTICAGIFGGRCAACWATGKPISCA